MTVCCSSLKQFACLARCNGAQATVYPPNESITLEEMRRLVIDVCSSPDAQRVLVASYHRGSLGQTVSIAVLSTRNLIRLSPKVYSEGISGQLSQRQPWSNGEHRNIM